MNKLDLAALHRALQLARDNVEGRAAYFESQRQQQLHQAQLLAARQAREEAAREQALQDQQPNCHIRDCEERSLLGREFCSHHQSNIDSWLDARKQRLGL